MHVVARSLFTAPLDTDMEKQRAELAAIIRRNTAEDGSYATAIGSLFMSRHSQSHEFAPVLAQPALCIMAQGRKEVQLAERVLQLRPAELPGGLGLDAAERAGGRMSRAKNRSWPCAWTSTRRKSPR